MESSKPPKESTLRRAVVVMAVLGALALGFLLSPVFQSWVRHPAAMFKCNVEDGRPLDECQARATGRSEPRLGKLGLRGFHDVEWESDLATAQRKLRRSFAAEIPALEGERVLTFKLDDGEADLWFSQDRLGMVEFRPVFATNSEYERYLHGLDQQLGKAEIEVHGKAAPPAAGVSPWATPANHVWNDGVVKVVAQDLGGTDLYVTFMYLPIASKTAK